MTATVEAPLKQRSGSSRLRTFRPDIEGFRAFAILMVVIHHAGIAVYGGVDTSFVLSGFLVTSMLMREVTRTSRIDFAKFFARRFKRLLPMATVVIVATLLASWAWAPVFKLRAFGLDGLFAAVSAINIRLASGSTDYFAGNAAASPFQHFWSLSIEEQFYAVWPVLFLGVYWFGRRLRAVKWVMAGALFLIIGVSLYLSITVTQSSQSWAYFGFHTRAWELAIGALTAVGAEHFARMRQSAAAVVAWTGLVVIGFGSVMISHSQSIPGSVMLWPVLGTALFIAGGCAAPRFGAEFLLKLRPVRFVGRTSYSLYLWHWPCLILVPYAVGHALSVGQNLLVVLGSFGLAVLSYLFVEAPIKARGGSLVRIPRSGLAFGSRLIVTSLVAAAAVLATTVAYAQPAGTTGYANPTEITQMVAAATQATSLSPLTDGRLPTAKDNLYPGCIADIPTTTATPCNIGDAEGKKVIVLLGSSLAWQWIPAINSIAQADHAKLVVFTKGSCPAETYSVDDTTQAQDGGATQTGVYAQCDTWRKDAYNKIAALHPQLVIMSSRAQAQATPTAISGSVQYFRHLGANVAVIGETPSFQFDVPTCLSANHSSLQKCTVARNVIFADTRQSDMAAQADREAGATVIDPLQWLCTTTQCPVVIDDQIVYWDAHHLSATYAVWLSQLLAKLLPKF